MSFLAVAACLKMNNETSLPTDLTGLNQWRITVPGDPVGQKRYAPTTRKGKKATYDPSSTQKETFRYYCMNGINDKWPDTPLVGALMIDLRFYFERPLSHYVNRQRSKGLKKTAPVYHTSTPDYDNCIKFVCDALNGKYYKDDRQICGGPTWQSWSDNPRTEVIIAALENK